MVTQRLIRRAQPPSVAPRRTPARELSYTTTRLASDGYESWEVEDRHVTDDIRKATLVSSHTLAGTHTPAFDVDHPTVLTVDDDGHVTIWFDAPLRRRGFRKLATLAADLGLTRGLAPTRADLRLAARREAYAAAAANAIDSSVRTATLRKAGADLGRTVEEVLDVAAAIHGGLGRFRGPAMANPWPLPLAAPVDVVESSSLGHHHVYLDAELTWPAYAELLRAAGKARLLESGYVKVSRNRRATHLRLPWVAK